MGFLAGLDSHREAIGRAAGAKRIAPDSAACNSE
jgi:hypothetical protein